MTESKSKAAYCECGIPMEDEVHWICGCEEE